MRDSASVFSMIPESRRVSAHTKTCALLLSGFLWYTSRISMNDFMVRNERSICHCSLYAETTSFFREFGIGNDYESSCKFFQYVAPPFVQLCSVFRELNERFQLPVTFSDSSDPEFWIFSCLQHRSCRLGLSVPTPPSSCCILLCIFSFLSVSSDLRWM